MEKIIVSDIGSIDVYLDDYDDGRVSLVSEHPLDVRGQYDTFENLVYAINKATPLNIIPEDCTIYNGTLRVAQQVNSGMHPADEREFEHFAAGLIDLYVAEVVLDLNVGDIHSMTDEEADLFGIDVSSIDVAKW
jgi:hypothetical protein